MIDQINTNKKIPTTVFSGFLGSGKTTIISSLIDEIQSKGQQAIYIKNEIGDSDVDGKIIEGKGIKTKELLNGCICCTLVGPFINSINEIVESFSPDRIIIEASGAADPSALALMISSHPHLTRDGVIGIIDVVNFEGYKDLSVTAQNQTKFTDLLVFNKVELASLEQKKAVVGYVRELNSNSPIIEAQNGKISSDLVFGLDSKDLSNLLEKYKDEDHHNESERSESDHVEKDKIQTFNLNPLGKFNAEELKMLLSELPKNIFRVKGFVKMEDEKFHLFNTVGKRTDFAELEIENVNQNLMIFIGFMAHDLKIEIQNKIELILKK